jgi:hypothetical protein
LGAEQHQAQLLAGFNLKLHLHCISTVDCNVSVSVEDMGGAFGV